MGNYTELATNFSLKKDTPSFVKEVLQYMCDNTEITEKDQLQHALFQTPRWSSLFQGTSAYFDWITYRKFAKINDQYFLTTRGNIKNYDQEIALFWIWIEPFIDAKPGEYVGYYCFENENPIYLYVGENGSLLEDRSDYNQSDEDHYGFPY